MSDNDATPTRQDVAANVDEIIEQAIETTVGRGTCHIKEVASYGYPFECSECKAWYGVNVLRGELRFCPNCGAEVVDE